MQGEGAMNRYALLAIVIGLLLWLVPSMMRDPSIPFPGPAAYVEAYDATHWQGSLMSDGHITSSMAAIVSYSRMPPLLALKVLALIAGVAGGLGLWLLLRRMQMPTLTALVALALYAVSSLSLSLFAVPSGLGFAVGCAMLAAGLLANRSLPIAVLGAPAAVLAALVSPVACLCTLVMCCGLLLWLRSWWRAVVMAAALVATALLAWHQLPLPVFDWVTPVIGVLAELGKPPGLAAMEWLIAVIGMGVLWASAGIPLFLLIAFASITTTGAAFALPLWVSLGAVAIIALYQRQWRVPLMRWDALLFVVLAILLATFIVASSLVNDEPIVPLVNGLTHVQATDQVLTHDTLIPYVRYFSNASVIAGNDTIWYSRDITNTTIELSSLGIDTLVITKQMREGQVWHTEDEGLLFLLDNSQMFTKRYADDDLEIWGFAPLTNS
jgi:hypothetical protein